MIEIGTVLQDRFLIEEQIGVGGMGAVYRATDQKFGTAVAIKETFYRDKDLAEAFEREARLLNGLHHPLFPHVSDHFTEGEGHFLVMEFIEGEDLSEILRRGERFPFDTVMRWTLDLLDGLDYLHSQDPPIIHRDIKPNNLKLTSRGNIVLLDFGMAKETSGNAQGMKSVFGYSRRYSPLEQIEGTGTDVRSDIFSLGATVHHLLTGTPPVDVLRRASAIVAGRPDPIELASAINPEVPERIAVLLNSALALNPDMRFASARAMWSALEHSLEVGKSAPAAAPVAPPPIFAAPVAVAAPPLEEPPAESFPALEAFEADLDTEAEATASGSAFRNVAEDENDPIAALIAQRVAQMKAADAGAVPELQEETFRPTRIEVPVAPEEPELIAEDVQELGAVDDSEREEISKPLPVPVGRRAPASARHASPYLLAIPLLMLVLGVVGYALYRGVSTPEETVQDEPVQQATTPESSPEEVSASSPAEEEAAPSEGTIALTEGPETAPPEEADVEDVTDAEAARAPVRRRTEPRATERARDGAAAAPEPRPSAPARDQGRNQSTANNRSNRSTRPRVVPERVFEQPPVSSIESIMTGIPSERPRRQRRWEVIEEDQLRRERRLRRIDRRNRQRWPLF